MTQAMPSLFAGAAQPPAVFDAPRQARSLVDLMYDGFYMLFLIKNRQGPSDEAAFAIHIQRFLDEFERSAKKLDVSTEDVFAAKYAFCAAVDELILTSQFKIRDAWERRTLQLSLFGDQLAGENFFVRLEALRQQGAPRLQAIEVYYLCLLLGFQGKYLIEGPEKLAYLIARLGDEIAHLKSKRAPFAPHWGLPDRVSHALKRDIPIWVIASVFALVGLVAFIGMRWMLDRSTEQVLAPYGQILKPQPRTANLTITLP